MKKVILVSCLLLITGLIWYLFIKPYDYLVKFSEKTSTGYVYNAITAWNEKLENSTLTNSVQYSEILQKVSNEQHDYTLKWKIDKLNDSISGIRLYVTEPAHSLMNRILLVFTESDLEKFSKAKGLELKNFIESDLSKSRVQIDGQEPSPEKFCACLRLNSSRKNKAETMIANKYIVPEFLENNRIPITDYPLLELERWDQQTDSITFNFCFPVEETDTLPANEVIFYKKFQSLPSIKSTFYGNYRTSDNAWFALLDYAGQHNIQTSQLPLEIYYNNPHNGGNELEWKADIYMPLKTSN